MTACREARAAEVAKGAEQQLMQFVRKLTVEPGRMERNDVERLRDAGWTDEQIAEAVYITALFAFFNRVASAYGLEDPRYEERQRAGDPNVPPPRQATPDGL